MSKSQISIDEKLPNIHPGEILKEEFLDPMNVSAYRLAKETNIPQTRISDIIHGKRNITADTALRFSRFFGTTSEFWLNLQNAYDLEKEKQLIEEELLNIKQYKYACLCNTQNSAHQSRFQDDLYQLKMNPSEQRQK